MPRLNVLVNDFAVYSMEGTCILPRSTCCMTQSPTCIKTLQTVQHDGLLINCIHAKQDKLNT